MRGRVRVAFGEPMDFSRYAGMSGNAAVERQVTDQIMLALKRLSGQEYVDLYAAKVKTVMERTGKSAVAIVSDLIAASKAPQRTLEET